MDSFLKNYLVFSIILFPVYIVYLFIYIQYFKGIITYFLLLINIIYVIAMILNIIPYIIDVYDTKIFYFIFNQFSLAIIIVGLMFYIIPLILTYIYLNIDWKLIIKIIKSIIDFWNTKIN